MDSFPNDIWGTIVAFVDLSTFFAVCGLDHRRLFVCRTFVIYHGLMVRDGGGGGLLMNFENAVRRRLKCVCEVNIWDNRLCRCIPCSHCGRRTPLRFQHSCPIVDCKICALQPNPPLSTRLKFVISFPTNQRCDFGCWPHCRTCNVELTRRTMDKFYWGLNWNETPGLICKKCAPGCNTQENCTVKEIVRHLYSEFYGPYIRGYDDLGYRIQNSTECWGVTRCEGVTKCWGHTRSIEEHLSRLLSQCDPLHPFIQFMDSV